MNLYAFQLGKHPKLSLCELKAVIGEDNFLENNGYIAIFQLPPETDVRALQDKLGGTIKIIEILKFLPLDSDKKAIEDAIQGILAENFKDHSGKLPFAVSNFGCKHIYSKEVLNFSKKFLKSLDISSRFVNKDQKNPKPSTIFKARVLQKGIDLNFIKGKQLYLGRTAALQDIDSYSFRDFEKPYRDAKNGMLPPKLSQMMINLAGESTTIYDPFCGNGTILLEALLMGKKAIGSDLNAKLVEHSEGNCRWLSERYKLDTEYKTFVADAQGFTIQLKEPISAIVTEGYLGPPLEKSPTAIEIEKIFRELGNLHLNWLTEAAKILKKGQKVIMCLTAFRQKEQIIAFPNFEEILKLSGFTMHERLLYQREDQVVLREILILERV